MVVCCIPQQNPALYLFLHKLIHNRILRPNFTSTTQSFSLQFQRAVNDVLLAAPVGALSE
ncbi:hypothetical protein CYR40_21580 [Chimaeribacter arupi]|uniref:Uncharacterized protein n=1 Tax=Chimaeribacter arupi TaxID=2060066 RepID=A0A2N5EHJ1_9GAMM|nr:hypothetical protein CYR23_20085 [Chimaeribacter arupi]PLR42120.1 hypothetical protein CYR40_21580 [Chimaeribacter arupi]PLR42827.1 hypothetical protein CYR52_20800 [Chimaeribacter arupi]PLR43546.1 hypothetical protein CYR34_20505 [Chimaeribacter arupi]